MRKHQLTHQFSLSNNKKKKKSVRRRERHSYNKGGTMNQSKFFFFLTFFLFEKVHSKLNEGRNLLVVGSLNADTFLPVSRLPVEGENLTLLPDTHPEVDVAGGKGCNQAIACAKFLHDGSNDGEKRRVAFIGQFGNDDAGEMLKSCLVQHGVEISSLCQTCNDIPSGRGYVFLQASSGKVSAIVSGGSNLYGWNDDWKEASYGSETSLELQSLLKHTSCVLLQREVPEYVNFMIAYHAQKEKDVIVIQDVGGEDRPMQPEMMSMCDYIVPNASELIRLVKSVVTTEEDVSIHDNSDDIVEWATRLARLLQKHGGANHVLVTLGDKGSLLVPKDTTEEVIYQPACQVPGKIIDETGAGDCYRAAFAVALSTTTTTTINKRSLRKCMQFASAAGALAVTKKGAVPSIPTKKETATLCHESFGTTYDNDDNNDISESKDVSINNNNGVPRGGATTDDQHDINDDDFHLMFGSRLNSMKDRPELWDEPVDNVREWVKRQGMVKGLGCVDFNYPQHFHSWTTAEAKEALESVGLVAGAVCLRYPSKFARGAMNHPDVTLRREAIEMTKAAAQVALDLGCNEVVVWSAYDGYDYPFQVDYEEKWQQLVEAFQECCDSYPDIRWSLEFKPTDENTRFFTVPSTGAALLLVKDIDRPNMGLTLDMGHMLMAGENPGQSISMVGDRLFGIQLNDGYTRLAAEDGMMFGSIHPSMALEAMYQIQNIKNGGFKGHLYFDTFPQRTDPIKEAEYNIQRVKKFWKAASKLDEQGIRKIMQNHDAIGALEAIDHVLNR